MPLTTYTAGQVLTAQSLNDNFAFAAQSGLVVVQPETAVTSSTTITLDNCFTSTYTNYLIFLNASTVTAAANTDIQLRIGGVTTTTNYNQQFFQVDSGSTTQSRATSQTGFRVSQVESDFRNVAMIHVMQPQQAQVTNFFTEYLLTAGASLSAVVTSLHTGNQTATTQFDGFIITCATAMTGSYSVYGYGK